MEIIQMSVLKKYQTELLVALALILLGAGIGYNTASEAPYNPYEARVLEIDMMMQNIIDNPAERALVDAQQDLFYTYYPWAERQVDGQQKEIFVEYLEACNQIIISISKGLEPDTGEMIRLKNELI